MELGVPVVDGSMVAAEGQLEIVVVVEANDGSLDVSGIRRGLSREAQFAEIGDPLRQRRSDVQNELSQGEAAVSAMLVGGRKIHIGKTAQLHRRKVVLCGGSTHLMLIVFVHLPGSAWLGFFRPRV